MKKLSVAACLIAAMLGMVAVALAGPFADDNDYEGRVKGEEETYFGFDVSNDGQKVRRISGFFFYRCESGKAGEVFARTRGSLEVNNGRFEGRTTGPSKGTAVFDTTGRFRRHGKATGTVEAKLRLGPTDTCTARNDGEWNARRGRDIDVSPLR